MVPVVDERRRAVDAGDGFGEMVDGVIDDAADCPVRCHRATIDRDGIAGP